MYKVRFSASPPLKEKEKQLFRKRQRVAYPNLLIENQLGENDLSPEELAVLEEVLKSVRQIRFGYVQITIQDGKVVQIDKTEKYRLNQK